MDRDLDQLDKKSNPTGTNSNPTRQSLTIFRISSAISDKTETKATKHYGYGCRKRKWILENIRIATWNSEVAY